ncbi:hypothetical protein GIW31_26750 [Pseudomonas sp. PA-5-4H]|jgi:DHA1 family inner membrane transport protein|nr:hypothetical protein [Pseudomonas sp. PA-5-4H]
MGQIYFQLNNTSPFSVNAGWGDPAISLAGAGLGLLMMVVEFAWRSRGVAAVVV